MHTKPPAIILGGSENAVSVARSLSRAGVPVSAVGEAASAVRWSRACDAFVDPPGSGDVQDRWLGWLLRDGSTGGVLVPCDDDALELIARNREQLMARSYLPVEADDDVLLAMLDKHRTYALARSAGIPSPDTHTLRTPADLDKLTHDVQFPCALKPAHSHLWRRHVGLASKAVVVNDRSELELQAQRLLEVGLVLLVTEVIPGPEDAFFSYYGYLDENGEPLLHFTKRKLRQNPPGFGRGCYHITEWQPEVAALGLAFMQRLGLRGLACIEFKRDARDGRLKLIECNHRITAADAQLQRAGLDLPVFLYNRALGLPLPPVGEWRSGVRLWSPLADLRAFRSLRAAGQLTSTEWLRSVAHRQHTAVFAWNDPMPTVRQGMARLGRLSHRTS